MTWQYIEPMLRPLFSSQCEVCRRWNGERLCPTCLVQFSLPVLRCERCALRVGAAVSLCGACLREPPPFERTLCVADYAFPWDRLIIDFKFHRQPELSRCLADQLVRAVRSATHPLPDIVVPVPLSSARLAERGYNQAWEVARRTASALRVGASASLLSRVIDTPYQAALGRTQRLANLRAAFVAQGPGHKGLRGQRVALVDDVLTTGATAEECSRALLRAGAFAVELWVLARTPAPA